MLHVCNAEAAEVKNKILHFPYSTSGSPIMNLRHFYEQIRSLIDTRAHLTVIFFHFLSVTLVSLNIIQKNV